jgi:hypothetical protein
MAIALALMSTQAWAGAHQLCSAKATTGFCSNFNNAYAGNLHGHKTVAIAITGTATVVARCIIGNDEANTKAQIVSASSSGFTETDSLCSDIEIEVTSCSSCSVNAWVATDN